MKRVLKIVQMSKYRWVVQNDKGDQIGTELYLNDKFKAEAYIRAFVSSFLDIGYEVVTLTKETK